MTCGHIKLKTYKTDKDYGLAKVVVQARDPNLNVNPCNATKLTVY